MIALIFLALAAGFGYFFLTGRRAEPGLQKTEVMLYFVNREYIATGNEDLPKLVAVTRRLQAPFNGVVKTNRESLVKMILKELQRPPADEQVTTALRDDLTIAGVRVEEVTVYVDFSSDNLHGGSLEEILLVEQIVTTLTGLPGLEKVQFLVDGERRDTLMGHISADEPLGREDL